MQVSFTAGARVAVTTVGLGGATRMAALEVTETRLLLLDDDEEDPDDDDGDEEHEEALGDGEQEDDVPDEVFVSRRRLPTCLPVSAGPAPPVGCELAPPTATKPPLDRLREYRDPAAASDKRLEQREHVATEAQLRSRFCGLMGSTDWAELVKARTVSHFRSPLFGCEPSRGTDFGGARLVQLTSFFSRGTTDHSFW